MAIYKVILKPTTQQLEYSGLTAGNHLIYLEPTLNGTTTTTTTLSPTTTTTTTTIISIYLIDLGVSTAGYPTVSPASDGAYWNNFSYGSVGITGNTMQSGTTLSNLIDTNNNSSNLGIELITNNWLSNSNGGVNSTLTGVSSYGYIYPGSANRDTFTVNNPNTGITNIVGCDDNKIYSIGIFSSRTSEPLTTFIVQEESKTINPNQNTTILVWNNITSISGIITIKAHQPTSGKKAWINVIEIMEQS